jgi:hypothetical protein
MDLKKIRASLKAAQCDKQGKNSLFRNPKRLRQQPPLSSSCKEITAKNRNWNQQKGANFGYKSLH